jgi:hypothetical protein
MCTVVVLRRPHHRWPLLIAANRDEMLDRPWKPPARHWPDREDVMAGLDETAGGTWMGINDSGVFAGILNRHGFLGPAPDKRSRGELVLEALDHADAKDAAGALADVDPTAYRPFNMVIADNRDAWWLSAAEKPWQPGQPLRLERIPEGLSMFTAFDRNDLSDRRIAQYLPKFQAADIPDPDKGEWESWRRLLAGPEIAGVAHSAMAFRVPLADGTFGTSSSSLLALPSPEAAFGPEKKRPIWLFASGSPEDTAFLPVDLDP